MESIALGRRKLERADGDVDLAPAFIDPVETAEGGGRFPGDMVAIVGKGFSGGEAGSLADDAIALDDAAVAAGVLHDPLAA